MGSRAASSGTRFGTICWRTVPFARMAPLVHSIGSRGGVGTAQIAPSPSAGSRSSRFSIAVGCIAAVGVAT
uniref:Uncharacterized protein n=1 Tax=Oryza barthii TaxID=65489 RepID=A0A0D3GQ21_9ORYZ